ncbi:hypothetical protein TSH100_13840 [Azospirillum sp. TSH100]|uniref:hypothetical protein n=1 Tax=Azospirillum sp. TSH100 TaxID=652764 RepID=UPI000D60AF0A|nr:hypothetical protein [Azospirillum sp. TSH100]PWC86052.1 hypothetical protein TSH100_13840 [Azospirillum sp. TSH100]QCG89373.1 hypothetical protein E6C72_16415 [Azospirillum sp. TSH100]
MPVSVREQILTAFQGLLGTVVAENVTGTLTVYRGRRKAVPEEKLPALVMRGSPVSSDQESAAVTRNFERVAVTALAKDATDAGLDRTLVDLWAALQRAIEADPTLGGIAVDTTITEADQGAADDEGVGGLGDVFIAVTVEYWTRPGDPYALAP